MCAFVYMFAFSESYRFYTLHIAYSLHRSVIMRYMGATGGNNFPDYSGSLAGMFTFVFTCFSHWTSRLSKHKHMSQEGGLIRINIQKSSGLFRMQTTAHDAPNANKCAFLVTLFVISLIQKQTIR